MSNLTPTELLTYLARIAEDGVCDGVEGRTILKHNAAQRQRIAQLEAEVARLNGIVTSLKQSEMHWVDEAEKYSAEVARLKARLFEFTGDEDGHIL